jgi:hypothetical protein
MADITTDFVGSEDAATRLSRLQSIYDYYYGSGAFVAANNLGGVRAGMNAMTASDISNGEAFGSWLTKANYLNDPDNARTELATLVGTKTAAYWDFSDASTVFEDDTLLNPAEVADGVKGFTARAVGGLASAGWFEFGSNVPVWQTTYGDFNGTNAFLQGTATQRAMFQNAAAGVLGVSFRLDTLAAAQTLVAFSEGVTQTTVRFSITVEADGSFRVTVNRADGDSVQSDLSGTGVITTATVYTIIATVDWATGGAGALKGYLNNGSDLLNHTLTGSGNTSNTASLRSRLGSSVNSLQFTDGRIYRAFAGAFIPTTAERALINGVLRGGL